MKRSGWLGFFLVLALAACAEEAPRLEPLLPGAKILAFGDSLTAGTGAEQGSDYPSLLAKKIQRLVINGGVPGELSDEGLIRLPQWLDRYHPALLILCHGGNDILMQKDHVRIANNIRRMIQLARDRGTQVVLIGVPQPGITLSPLPFYREIARDFSIPYEGKILSRLLSTPALKSDHLHANEEGYQALAEALAKLLKDRGALAESTL